MNGETKNEIQKNGDKGRMRSTKQRRKQIRTLDAYLSFSW